MMSLIYSVVYCLIEGAAYTVSMQFLLTKYFGYPVKKDSRRTRLFLSAVILYAGINTVLYGFTGKIPGWDMSIGGFFFLFLLLYWLKMSQVNKLKTFFVTVISIEIIMVIITVFEDLSLLIGNRNTDRPFLALFFMIPVLAFTVAVIGLFSYLSSRQRKGAMPFSLVIANFLLFLFLSNLLSAFGIEDETRTQTFFSLRFLWEGERNSDLHKITLLVICLILLMICILFFIKESESVYFREKNTVSEYYLEAQKEHFEQLTASNREIRKIRHDLKNHVYCMQKLVQNENYEELKKYIDDMANRVEQADNSVHVGDEMADAICSEKKKKAEELGIELQVDGELSGVRLSALDTCTILANLLDNAIEAVQKIEAQTESEKRPQKQISLSFRKNKNYLIITEINPVAAEVEIRDNEILTTKEKRENHGFGIVNIKEAAAKYGGECFLSAEFSEKDKRQHLFRFEILIPMSDS